MAGTAVPPTMAMVLVDGLDLDFFDPLRASAGLPTGGRDADVAASRLRLDKCNGTGGCGMCSDNVNRPGTRATRGWAHCRRRDTAHRHGTGRRPTTLFALQSVAADDG